MKNFTQDNWYSWHYADKDKFGRQESDDKLFTEYSSFSGHVGTFKEELEKAASSTLDSYPGLRPNIFFSGGVDSELIVRSYLNIGANPKIYIVRYKNDLNIYDVSYAITVCSALGIDYTLVDFDLESFYENEALTISREAQIDRPRMLPHLKFTDCADGLIIVGHSDIAWYRPTADYQTKTEWIARDFEHDLGCDKYNALHNRDAIFQWWKWSPGLVLSYTRLNWFQELVSDKFEGKLGINSTKIFGFREIYPDMIMRKKQTGFERIDLIIDEVEKDIAKAHGGNLPYRQYVDRSLSTLTNEILGHDKNSRSQ